MTNNIYYTIGKNIKKYRKKIGLTKKDLSSKTNLSYKYIKNIEDNGVDESITIETLNIIAKALNITIYDLIKRKIS